MAPIPSCNGQNPGVHRAVGRTKALVVDSEELFQVLFDDLFEVVRRGTRRVASAARRGEDGHGRAGRRAAGRRQEGAQGASEKMAGGASGGRREDSGRLK